MRIIEVSTQTPALTQNPNPGENGKPPGAQPGEGDKPKPVEYPKERPPSPHTTPKKNGHPPAPPSPKP